MREKNNFRIQACFSVSRAINAGRKSIFKQLNFKIPMYVSTTHIEKVVEL